MALLDQSQSIGQHGEGGEAQKIHLQQAHLFDGLHIEGSDDLFVLGAVQWNQIDERLRCDHHAGGMHTGIAHQSFQLARCV